MIFLLTACSEGDSDVKNDNSRIKTVVPTILDENGNVLREGGVLDRDGNIVPAIAITSTPPILNVGSGGGAGGNLSLSGFQAADLPTNGVGTWQLQDNGRAVTQTKEGETPRFTMTQTSINQVTNSVLSWIPPQLRAVMTTMLGLFLALKIATIFTCSSLLSAESSMGGGAGSVYLKKMNSTLISDVNGFFSDDGLLQDSASASLEKNKTYTINIDFDGNKYAIAVKDGANNQTLFSHEINDNSLKRWYWIF